MFSAACRIVERMILDTGSIRIPELEYDAVSNKNRPIQQIERIDLETIYAMINYHLQPPVIQTSELINQLNN
jgi:hypothetical protein